MTMATRGVCSHYKPSVTSTCTPTQHDADRPKSRSCFDSLILCFYPSKAGNVAVIGPMDALRACHTNAPGADP